MGLEANQDNILIVNRNFGINVQGYKYIRFNQVNQQFLFIAGAVGDGIDFASDRLTALFTPGASQVTVPVNITRDEILEQTEMLKFTLTVPDKFSDITGMLLIETDDNDEADGEIINSVGI